MRRLDAVIRISWKKVIPAAVAFLVIAGVCVGLTLHFFTGRDTKNRPDVESIGGIPVHTALIPDGVEGRPGYTRQVKYIVIHETGNPSKGADAKAHSDYLQSGNSGTTSWHYTVDDHEIYHHIPDGEVAWHAGDKLKKDGGNLCGISLELCVNKDGEFDKTFDNGAKLTAYLLNAYHLDRSDIKQHYDFNEKNCPQTIREAGRWNEFLTLVEAYQKELKK